MTTRPFKTEEELTEYLARFKKPAPEDNQAAVQGVMKIKAYSIIPCTKPRMTRRDKWLSPPRPGVARYWAFKDEVQAHKITLPECEYHVTFILPMPASWSKKKRLAMDGKPHQQTPDKDNLEKALLDAIFGQDCHIWDG